jgi:flagellar biosynthesis/type III secretory pathway protein FliH
MTTPASFSVRPLVRAPQGFTPMAGLGSSPAGFVQHSPQNLVRQSIVESPAAASVIEPHREPVAAITAPAPVVAQTKSVILTDQIRAQLLAEGQAQGRAEAIAELAPRLVELDTAAALLRQILDGIALAVDAETDALAQTLGQLVRTLASERAGSRIDHDPASFATRIATLAERISDGFAGLAVTLNPHDLAALRAAAVPEASDLVQAMAATLQSDASLARGDVRLRAQGLALDDLIHNGGHTA